MRIQINFKRFMLIALSATLILAVASCKKDSSDKASDNPKPNLIAPGEGAGGTVLTLTGKGLGEVTKITFKTGNVLAPFNPNFNTDGAVIFRVPDAAQVGDQQIVFTNAAGKEFSVPFKVLALVNVSSAFPMEYEHDNIITLTGNYFETVDDVTLEGGTDKATIVTKTATQLVLKMPTTTVKAGRLFIHNNAGSRATPMTFVNMEQQYRLFTEDFASGIQNWSWCAAAQSGNFSVSGTKSLQAKYSSGGWQGLSLHTDNVVVASDYQALVFWVKGGTAITQIDIKPDAVASGSAPGTTITVPANDWTYFKVPIAGTLGGASFQRFNFQMHGPDGGDQTVYLDNVYLLK